VCVCVSVYVCVCACASACLCVCACASVCLCVCACASVCLFVCACVSRWSWFVPSLFNQYHTVLLAIQSKHIVEWDCYDFSLSKWICIYMSRYKYTINCISKHIIEWDCYDFSLCVWDHCIPDTLLCLLLLVALQFPKV